VISRVRLKPAALVAVPVLVVLLAIGVGILVWEHRKAPTGESVLALHQAFAERLRAQGSGIPEVKELTLPNARNGEALLALALAEDARLLAITTTHRLLCLIGDEGRWAAWQLSQPVKEVGALHVDSETGKAHVVIGDDGRLVTADCRASRSSLIESATLKQPAVAWFDADESLAWVAPVEPGGAEVTIIAAPLPGTKGDPVKLQAAFPGAPNSLFANAAVVHSMARVGENILLFYGDSNLFHDSDLRDESLLATSIDEPERQTNRTVFPVITEEEKDGRVRWVTTHVRRVLPSSAPGRIYALTVAPYGVAVLGSNAKPFQVHADSLFATDHLNLKSSGRGAVLEVRREGTAASLTYELPWRFKQQPELAAISREGGGIAVANAAGDILLIDLTPR
jgi:hypothetical protein